MTVSIDLTQIIKAYDVRGLVASELSPDVAEAIGAAFARVVVIPDFESRYGKAAADAPAVPQRPQVVIGNDMRDSGPALVAAFTKGLTDAGVDVTKIGLCSTDGLYFAAASRDIPGAMFTASHNPAEYNGIKMCYPGAKPVGEASGLKEIRELAQTFLDGGLPAPIAADQQGHVTTVDDLPNYAQFLRGLVDLRQIRPLKVVIDAGNGMGGYTAPAVLGTEAGLKALPLDLVPLYWELDGSFPNHEANPLDPANLVDLQKAVVENGADLGLAFDGDADRCFVVDEKGNPVPPSVITILVGLRELARAKAGGGQASAASSSEKEPKKEPDKEPDKEPQPTLIYNLISSKAVPERFQAAGAQVVRTRVGHSFIKAQMAQHDAVFGGEHSGHYYFRDFWFADSGMLAALHVLAALGSQNRPLSELAAQYQPYVQSGEINSRVSDVNVVRDRVVAAMQAAHPDVTVDDLDGVTVSLWKDAPESNTQLSGGKWWFNLRGSNTEPLLRLNVEATDPKTMAAVRDQVLNLIKQLDA